MKYRRNKPLYFSTEELETCVKGLAKLNSELNKSISEIKSADDIDAGMFLEKSRIESMYEKINNELELRKSE